MARDDRGVWIQRALALLLCILGIPLILGLSGFFKDTPIREGEPSSRTVISPTQIRVEDAEATDRVRRDAAATVDPVVVEDREAQREVVQRVQDAFAAARAAREPGPDDRAPSRTDQVEALREQLTQLDDEALQRLVSLSDSQLERTATEAVDIAGLLARQEVLAEEVEEIADGQLQTELAVGAFPEGVAATVVDPIIRDALQPTVRVDEAATAEARAQAAQQVADIVQTFQRDTAIVRVGEVVSPVQAAALRQAGLEGADPGQEFLKAALLAAVHTFVVGLYVRAYRTSIWNSGRQLLLISVLTTLFAALLVSVNLMNVGEANRFYLVPVGAITMLATILFDFRIGVLMVIPATTLVAFAVPGTPGIVPFSALAGLVSIPLVSRESARGHLRRAAWQATLAYMVLAGATSLIYSGTQDLGIVLGIGLLNGVLTAVIVNGLQPFLESVFGILTATSLLDLADRNHALMRELEQKALGSYNHSIMVSTMVQRACRAVGADPLLGEVCALYHDIGKVAKPYFFVENQFGIANPHDALADPRKSALIIQRHVTDGVDRATIHHLPAEVVDGIRTHHGTTLVKFFYRQAVSEAEAKGEPAPPEQDFRYKGNKPFTRELAILMLADCCESASRAAAQHDRNLSKEALERIVLSLITERIEDGQLDDSPLTFADLRIVEESFIASLVGVYHPRITYPDDPRKVREPAETARRELDAEAEAARRASPAGRPVGGSGETVEADADKADTRKAAARALTGDRRVGEPDENSRVENHGDGEPGDEDDPAPVGEATALRRWAERLGRN